MNNVNLEDSIPMRLRHAYLTMHRVAQMHFSKFGVTVDQYVLLSILANEDGITQTELSQRMCSDGNTITAMLRLLEEKEFISRERCISDGRARRVHLTVIGRRFQKKLIRGSNVLHSSIENGITASERKSLFTMLDRLTDVLMQSQDKKRKVG